MIASSQLRDGAGGGGNACVPSQKENVAEYGGPEPDKEAKPTGFNLVDAPGHPRLSHIRNSHLESAKGVVLFVDSTDLAKSVPAAARQLFDLLASPAVKGVRGVMVACSKAESMLSKPKEAVLKELNAELRILRKNADADSAALDFLGADGSLDVSGDGALPITMAEVSATDKEPSNAAVHVFINEVIAK